jgi:hypothetical protein
MTLMSCRLLRRKPLILFALFVFSLFIFQPRVQPTAASTGQPISDAQDRTSAHSSAELRSSLIALYAENTIQRVPVNIDIKKKQTKVDEILAKLSTLGPVFPAAAFSMSNFAVEGFVRGRWPIVVVYELEADSTAEVTVSTINDGKREAFRIQLQPTKGEPLEEKRQIPEAFGRQPQLGAVSFRAVKNGPEPRKPAHFFLYGLGVGDKAVGSIVIDQLKFQPSTIHPKLKEKASYSFHSRSDFNAGAADFMRVTRSPDNVIHFEPVAGQLLKDGIGRDEQVANDWDGKNDKGKVSPGPHQFRVRVWRGLKSGGDWVSAFSPQVVTVE